MPITTQDVDRAREEGVEEGRAITATELEAMRTRIRDLRGSYCGKGGIYSGITVRADLSALLETD